MTAGSVAANQRVAEIYVEGGDGAAGARGGAAELNVASDGDIVVTSGLNGTAVARIRVLGGDSPAATSAPGTTPGQGGDARIGSATTPAGAISVTSRIADAIVLVEAGDGSRPAASESARGGAASITSNGISAVSRAGAGEAKVTAASGDSVGESLGVDASINSSGGPIKVLSENTAVGQAIVQASGGKSETGTGAFASVQGGGINVQSGGSDASVLAQAGLSDSGAGGSARVESTGAGNDIVVATAGLTANARVEAIATQARVETAADGGDATVASGRDITVTGNVGNGGTGSTGAAMVRALGKSSTAGGTGGAALVSAARTVDVTSGKTQAQIIVTGGTGSVADGEAGAARLTASGVNITSGPTAGNRAAEITVTGGAGTLGKGGAASLTVANNGKIYVKSGALDSDIKVTGGAATAPNTATTGGAARITSGDIAVTSGTGQASATATGGLGIAGGGNATIASGAISVTGGIGWAVLSATGRNGTGTTATGGAALITADGISVKSGTGPGAASVSAQSGPSRGTADGVGATIDSSGKISAVSEAVAAAAATATVLAAGGNSGTGKAGNATVWHDGIEVTSGGSTASVTAEAGTATIGAGGSASILSKDGGAGDITVSTKGSSANSFTANATVAATPTAAYGTAEADGGSATITSGGKITVEGALGGAGAATFDGEASVRAIGARGVAGGDGGKAEVKAADGIAVSSGRNAANITVTGGFGSATGGDAGDAVLEGSALSLTAELGTLNRAASIDVTGGTVTPGREGLGGSAYLNIDPDGAVNVTSGFAAADINVKGTDGTGTAAAGGGEAKIVSGAISVTSRLAGATISAVAGNGLGALSRGGDSSITAKGISAVSAAGGGEASVTAKAGHSVGTIAGGAATIDSSGGKIIATSADATSGKAIVSAIGGDAATGTAAAGGGDGIVRHSGIEVTSGGDDAGVTAVAGKTTNGAGGSAQIVSEGDGNDIIVKSAGTASSAYLAAYPSEAGGAGSAGGGSATVTSGRDIIVDGFAGDGFDDDGRAFVLAEGTDGVAGGKGGDAEVKAGGDIKVTSGKNEAIIGVGGGDGGDGGTADGTAGSAKLSSKSLNLKAGEGKTNASAAVAVTGGASILGAGGAADLNVGTGDLSVASGARSAEITVTGGDGRVTGTANRNGGGDAKINSGIITVTGLAGEGSISARAGDATGPADVMALGGDSTVTAAEINVRSLAGDGRAFLSTTAGNSTGSVNGIDARIIASAGKITVDSAAGATGTNDCLDDADSGCAFVSAQGGTTASGAAGGSSIRGHGIEVTGGATDAFVAALAGDTGAGAGGSAEVVSDGADNDIKIATSGKGGSAYVIAAPTDAGTGTGTGAGSGVYEGGGSTVRSGHDIIVTGFVGNGSGAGLAFVDARGATGAAGGKGGDATVEAAGKISVTSGVDKALIDVIGGNNSALDSPVGAGAARLNASSLELRSGSGTRNNTAAITVTGGLGSRGHGGIAAVAVANALDVTSGTSDAGIGVDGGDGSFANAIGGVASVKAKGISVNSTAGGTATIRAQSGKSNVSGDGVDTTIDSSEGLISVSSATGTTATGTASLMATGGDATIGKAGGAAVTGTGIKAQAGGADAVIAANGGVTANGSGGDAKVVSAGTANDIAVATYGLAGSARVQAVASPAAGADNAAGGSASVVSARNIDVDGSVGTGTGTGTASLLARGSDSSGAAKGGDAEVKAAGAMTVTSGRNAARVSAAAGDGSGAVVNDANPGGGGDARIVSGALAVTANNSDASVRAYAGDGIGGTGVSASGGASTVAAGGISVKTNAGGAASVVARSGDSIGVADGANASVGSSGGRIAVETADGSTGRADVRAAGGAAVTGKAGGARIEGAGISVKAGGAGAYLTADAGATSDGAGGNAEVVSGGAANDITVASTGREASAAIRATATPARGSSEAAGGAASVTSARNIVITGSEGDGGSNIGGAYVKALAADIGGAGDFKGGDASVNAAGDVVVTSGQNEAGIVVAAGNGAEVGGDAGNASINAASFRLTSGSGASNRAATTLVQAGDGTDGRAGTASVNTPDGDLVVAAGTSDSIASLFGGDSAPGNDGGDAAVTAKNLVIRVNSPGYALLSMNGGDAAGTSDNGGDVSVAVTENMTVEGGDGIGTTPGGSAELLSEPGKGGTSGTDGIDALNVGQDAVIAGGDASDAASGGGAVVETFDDVRIGRSLTLVTGIGTSDTVTGGLSKLKTANLSVPTINLTRNGHSDLQFDGGAIDASTQNVTINTAGTINPDNPQDTLATSWARATRVNLANARQFTLNNEKGTFYVGTLSVTGAEGGRITVQDGDNLEIGTLDARNTLLYVDIPITVEAGGHVISAQYAYMDGTTMVLGGKEGLEKLVDGERFDIITTPAEHPIEGTLKDVFIDPDLVLQDNLFDRGVTFDSSSPGHIIITNRPRTAQPQLKALSEGAVGGQAFLNMGSDLAAGDGIASAVNAAADAGFSFYSALSYGHSRYDTGSHVDVDGLSFILGGAYGTDVSSGRLTVGAFFEIGDGEYDSYNDFSGRAAVRGSGDTRYVGGGIAGRADIMKSDAGVSYAEFSARAGHAETEFTSNEYKLSKRDLSSSYYGFHAGIGRVFNLTDSTSLDLFGKWLYTRQGA
ncbi:MAG: hypothetical protein LBR80_08175, partial [Deltaproteobacteria bacterium]|nr:hypothetical protein [Deltaproteobacteria bacterium]